MPSSEPKYTDAGATLSSCELYRYSLWRKWADGPKGAFVMLNPSTADGTLDDPTIRRVVAFAKAFGWGGVTVVNLFAFRATQPAAMLAAKDPVGPANDVTLECVLKAADAGVVCGWGRGEGAVKVAERAFAVRCMAARWGVTLTALQFTASGTPGHPLYIPAKARPIPYPHPGD